MKETDIDPVTEGEFKGAVQNMLRPINTRETMHENRKLTKSELNQRFRLVWRK